MYLYQLQVGINKRPLSWKISIVKFKYVFVGSIFAVVTKFEVYKRHDVFIHPVHIGPEFIF